MTEEQERLIVDNQMLVYKFLANHNIYDEDTFQDLMAHICSVIDKFDPEKAAFSTWVWTVCNNEMHHIYKEKTRGKVVPESLISSLDAAYTRYDDGDNMTLGESIPDDRSSDGFDSIEAGMVWDKAVELYKNEYPKSQERDLYIFRSIVLRERTTIELAKEYNITKQAINLIFHRTRQKLTALFMNDKKKHKASLEAKSAYAHKVQTKTVWAPIIQDKSLSEKISDIEIEAIATPIKKSVAKILYPWIYSNLTPTYDESRAYSLKDINKLLSTDLCVEFSEHELKLALAHCGFVPYKHDAKGNDLYGISEKSPIFRKLKGGVTVNG